MDKNMKLKISWHCPFDIYFKNFLATIWIVVSVSAFAVGGLLGDVFLHLLPEAYQQVNKEN